MAGKLECSPLLAVHLPLLYLPDVTHMKWLQLLACTKFQCQTVVRRVMLGWLLLGWLLYVSGKSIDPAGSAERSVQQSRHYIDKLHGCGCFNPIKPVLA